MLCTSNVDASPSWSSFAERCCQQRRNTAGILDYAESKDKTSRPPRATASSRRGAARPYSADHRIAARPDELLCLQCNRMFKSSNGTAAAAASSSFGGYWNRLQNLGVMVWKPPARQDRRRAEQRPSPQKGDQGPRQGQAAPAGWCSRRAVVPALPPRMADASSSSPGMLSSAFADATNTKGNVYQEMTKMIPSANQIWNDARPASAPVTRR